jgi:drug/metabolite transporter (DMT)-like permease
MLVAGATGRLAAFGIRATTSRKLVMSTPQRPPGEDPAGAVPSSEAALASATGGSVPGDVHRSQVRTGLVLATVSAAAFGSSGPMAKALLESGWTAGAAVLVRLGGAAVLLGVAALVTQRRRARLDRAALGAVVVYGVVAMAGVQLAFFNAVRTLDVGVALLLEYLAPVLLLGWTSVRMRQRPPTATLVGAGLTLVGLALVLDLTGAGRVDPVGVAWGLVAAVCLASYFALSARAHDRLPPLVMAAGGTAVGAVVIAVAGLVGLVPLAANRSVTDLAGSSVSWIVPALWLVLISTVVAYLTGISGVVRLGSRTASFVSLSEVMFAVVVAWLLLAELPRPLQLVGGALILTGIVVVQRTELGPPPPEPDRSATPLSNG